MVSEQRNIVEVLRVICEKSRTIDITLVNITKKKEFLILNFRRVWIVVSFLLGKSPAPVY